MSTQRQMGLAPRTLLVVLLATIPILLGPANVVLAHPLGNFTVNHYSGLAVRATEITLDFVIDMAEIPAFQEIQRIDKNGNGQVDADEGAAYHPRQCAELEKNLTLRVNQQPLRLTLQSSSLEFPPGAGGLLTLRLTCVFQTRLSALHTPGQVDYRDDNYAERIGWREIVVQGDGVMIANSNALTQTQSERLSAYPQDMLSAPLAMTTAHFEFKAGGAQLDSANAPPSFVTRTNDPLAALITPADLSLPIVLLSLALAIGLGAAHAVSPGHGKTIMAAYLVGARGTIHQALLLGMTVTVTHTAGVLVLGMVILYASQVILPESLYPWLSLTSGLLVVVMGLALFVSRWRDRRSWREPDAAHHTHAHGTDEPQAHEHAHGHQHGHSHLPADFQAVGLTWKNLLALGLVGGLVPSTSALILLLSAIALNRIAFGLMLIVAFGLGMAFVLVGIGVLLVRASHFLERQPRTTPVWHWLPLASAVVVVAAGLLVSVQALIQMGAIRP